MYCIATFYSSQNVNHSVRAQKSILQLCMCNFWCTHYDTCKNKFELQSGYPSCRLAREMVVMISLISLLVKREAAAQFAHLTADPQNICEGITCLLALRACSAKTRTFVKESLQMHFKVAVRNFHALNASR